MFANDEIERMSRENMEKLQLARLKKQIKWACSKSSFYQRKYADAGIGFPRIESLADLQKLPYTYKSEIENIDSFEFLTMPLSGVLRISAHGEGDVFIRFYTQGDIAQHVEMVIRVLIAQGINAASKVAVLGDMSDSRILDIHYALENIGAAVILLGNNMQKAANILKKCQPDIFIGDTNLINQLPAYIKENKNISVLYLKEDILTEIKNAKTACLYHSAILGCAGSIFTCAEGDGFHIQEDYFYPELIDTNTGNNIYEAERVGELVITTLTAEAMPLLRYRTGIKTMWLKEKCACGRGLVRIG